MKPLGKRRRVQLILASAAMLGIATLLFGYAFRDGIQFFRTPSQIALNPPEAHEVFRIGGMVEVDSLVRRGITVAFRVNDGSASVPVVFSGVTPDLFREGEGVIATGRLVDGRFEAHEVLAKHDEDYMPRELADLDLE